jgi:hypothetical protein
MFGAAFASSDECDCREAYKLLIPIGGPLLLIEGDNEPIGNAALVFDSVAQTAGLLLAIIGIARFAASGSDNPEPALRVAPHLTLDATPIPGGAYTSLKWKL